SVGSGGQPFFTSIASFTDATHVVMVDAPSVTLGAVTFSYGYAYVETGIHNVKLSNFIRGIHVNGANRYHIDGVYTYMKFPLLLQNVLWGDIGDGFISNSTF